MVEQTSTRPMNATVASRPAVPRTIPALLRAGGGPSRALLAPGCSPLSYHALRAEVGRLARDMRAAGIGPHDRVAIVLPNGPEMAIAFLAVTSCAVAAPLNPAYRAPEFAFYLNDLQAKAIITLRGQGSAAISSIQPGTVHLVLDGSPGSLRLTANGPSLAPAESRAPHPRSPDVGDEALVLHTSGTTARPKIVPLTHRNLAESACNIAETLRLAPGDRCLNIMPLFHIHGLVGALLSSLAAGASVVCTPGFDAFRFLSQLSEFRPTWYTGVPTMHQLILQRASQAPDRPGPSLRFIRSSSAPLPPSVFRQLEQTFGTPVVEAYGMTEASHQIACNPLPPGERKPGSVGKPAGVEVAVASPAGLLEPGQRGEVVIKGNSVTSGYEGDPEINSNAFFGGWFRTGDEGYFDDEGYLFLAGRLKEIINRGGEKIAPREVDEVLLRYPGVAQAVTFAIPERRLGEEVAAAVVAVQGAIVDERDLRRFASEHLAPFKVPKKIVFVSEIPKGPTGKVQRIGLAELLGLGNHLGPMSSKARKRPV